MSAETEKIVTEMCMGLQGPLAGWTAMLSENVHYENIPLGPVQGREAAGKFLDPYVGDGHNCLVKNEILNTVSAGKVVMNERLETWVEGDVTVLLPVCGVFEVENGEITVWKDYWDLPTLQPFLQAVAEAGR